MFIATIHKDLGFIAVSGSGSGFFVGCACHGFLFDRKEKGQK
jgi:hypothetical protein